WAFVALKVMVTTVSLVIFIGTPQVDCSVQGRQVKAQRRQVDESEVVHDCEAGGLFRCDVRRADNEAIAFNAKALAQALVFVDIASEFTSFAFNADGQLA